MTLFYSFSREHIEIVALQNDLLFFKQRDGPYIPTLRLLHKCTLTSYLSICQFVSLSVCHSVCLLIYSYIKLITFTVHMDIVDLSIYSSILLFICPLDPFMLPRLQVDKGAIRFILSGANIMCPGLTSAGARMNVDLPEEMIVVS